VFGVVCCKSSVGNFKVAQNSAPASDQGIPCIKLFLGIP